MGIDCVPCPSFVCRNGMETNNGIFDISNVKTPPKTKRKNKLQKLSTLATKFSPIQVRLKSSGNNTLVLNPTKLLNRLEHSVRYKDEEIEEEVETAKEIQESPKKTPEQSPKVDTEQEDEH